MYCKGAVHQQGDTILPGWTCCLDDLILVVYKGILNMFPDPSYPRHVDLEHIYTSTRLDINLIGCTGMSIYIVFLSWISTILDMFNDHGHAKFKMCKFMHSDTV